MKMKSVRKDLGRSGAIFISLIHLQRIRQKKASLPKTKVFIYFKQLSVKYVAWTANATATKGQTVKITVTKMGSDQ